MKASQPTENIFQGTKNDKLDDEGKLVFIIGKYKFDYHHKTLKIHDILQKLTSTEANLLRLLCLNTNSLLIRNYALNSIWSHVSYFNARSMDVYISKLRKYLRKDRTIKLINVRKKGFKLIINEFDI
jgi:two-component system OmpR family response regulator